MSRVIKYLAFCIGCVVVFSFCSKQSKVDLNNSADLDTYLFKQTTSLKGYVNVTDTASADNTLYASTDRANSSTGSPHSKYFKTRWNRLFYSQHDTTKGRTTIYKLGSKVKDSSIIILNDYVGQTDAEPKDILVMMKLSGNTNNTGGWVWAGFKKDGTVLFPSKDKGSACYGCHKSAVYNDYLMEF